MKYNYYFQIAGLIVGIQAPAAIEFPSCMEPFQILEAKTADLCYEIHWEGKYTDIEWVVDKTGYSVWKKDGHYVRKRSICSAGEKYFVFLEKTETKGQYKLYIPKELWEAEILPSSLNFFQFLAMEEGLLLHDAFILHSSFVAWHGKGILFTAPSGTGKSTQADLWQTYEGADVYNGDRTVIRRIKEKYYGFGSPYAGSSGIYRNESAPICAIVILSQASENRMVPLRGRKAFLPIFSETLMNTWNSDYMERVTDLLMDTVSSVPIYHLSCRPDQDAVNLVKQTLFQ